ncbi:hypothetical protein SKAU_G00272150 [Synaphobranchus kaupii]|uniref:Uncharacterized protein n=1 Tax=Synaphobranchus kaupii TaxID=118154 RepID=A0A9Q1F0U7_SYNKA|nr:hypothetical protein SKAU_G00272150 [Synaphobranchus kaupii]
MRYGLGGQYSGQQEVSPGHMLPGVESFTILLEFSGSEVTDINAVPATLWHRSTYNSAVRAAPRRGIPPENS